MFSTWSSPLSSSPSQPASPPPHTTWASLRGPMGVAGGVQAGAVPSIAALTGLSASCLRSRVLPFSPGFRARVPHAVLSKVVMAARQDGSVVCTQPAGDVRGACSTDLQGCSSAPSPSAAGTNWAGAHSLALLAFIGVAELPCTLRRDSWGSGTARRFSGPQTLVHLGCLPVQWGWLWDSVEVTAVQLTWFAHCVCPRVVHMSTCCAHVHVLCTCPRVVRVALPFSHPRPRAGAVTAHGALLGGFAGTETHPDVAVLGQCVRRQARAHWESGQSRGCGLGLARTNRWSRGGRCESLGCRLGQDWVGGARGALLGPSGVPHARCASLCFRKAS